MNPDINTTTNNSQIEYQRTPKQKQDYIRLLRQKIVMKTIGTGLWTQKNLKKIKDELSSKFILGGDDEDLIEKSLHNVVTTIHALSLALEIPIEVCIDHCKSLDKSESLIKSVYEVYCPFKEAHSNLISLNPREIENFLDTKNSPKSLF